MKSSHTMCIESADKGTRQGAFALLAFVAVAGCGGGDRSFEDTGLGGADLCAGVVCTASDACHVAGTCDPATGMCSNPSAADGTACDDGNACTQTDSCQSGACAGGAPVICAAEDECHVNGTCDPATGMCSSSPAVPDGTPCTCGNCVAGTCHMKVLGSAATGGPGTVQPISIGLDADNIYFGNAYAGFSGLATVGSMPKAGAAQATPVATGFTGYPGLVVSGADLYFVDSVALWNVPADGSSMATQVATVGGSSAIAADNLNVYVTRYLSGDVMSYPIGGGMPVTIATGESSPARIVTDGINLYWINAGDKTIRQKAVSGGPISTLASNQQDPVDLALDATSVYWTDKAAGTVNKVPIGGGAITTLASGQSTPFGLTVAGTTVYWTNYADGSNGHAAKTSIAGGSPVTIIPGSMAFGTGPTMMTHDATCLYWIEIAFGRVLSAPL